MTFSRKWIGLAMAGLLLAGSAGLAAAEVTPDEPVFPALADAGAVATVEIEGPRYALELQHTDGGWIALDHGSYPVRADLVETIISSLAGMIAHAIVTEDPAQYGLYDLEGPGAGTEDVHVRILDGAGGVLADAIVGSPAAITDPPRSGIHVRLADDPAGWLAAGGFSLPMRLSAWFDTLLRVPGPEVASIAIYSGDTLLFQADKVDPATGTYGLTAINEDIAAMDRTTLDIDALRGLAQAVVSVTAEDVAARDAVPVPTDPRNVRITTQDGVAITLTVLPSDDSIWVAIDAEGPGAEEINTRTADWVFALPEFNTMTLGKEVTDLIFVAPESGGFF